VSGSSRRKAAGQADVFPGAGWRVVMGDRVVEVRGLVKRFGGYVTGGADSVRRPPERDGGGTVQGRRPRRRQRAKGH
jgi:hypothetical protein